MFRTVLMTGIALSLIGTALAQQKTDPQLKQQAETIFQKWTQSINDYDARTRDLQTADAITISPFGVDTPAGAEQSAKRNKANEVKVTGSVKDVQQIDDDTALSYGPYEFSNKQGSGQGNWMQVLEKQGSDWKVRAMAYSRMPQQAATTSSGQQPAASTGSSTSK